MTLNTNITVTVPAIEKLVDHLASGLGAVGGVMLASRRARQEAQARRISPLGEADAQRILTAAHTERLRDYALAQSEARKLLISPDSAVKGELDISDAIESRLQFQEHKRHRNIEAVVGQAALELGDKMIEDSEPDHDWTARFFSEVQDVSSQDMQLLWAKVLAGEVERPGNTSVRTLSILRNIDKKTALKFQTLCSLCVSLRLDDGQILDSRVPSLGKNASRNGLSDYGLQYDVLNVLSEHGLIIGDYDSYISYEIYNYDLGRPDLPHLFFQGTSWDLSLVEEDESPRSRSFDLHGVALTHAGKELLPAVKTIESPEYTQVLMDYFRSRRIEMTPK